MPTSGPYVCDECRRKDVNWYDNCPHAPSAPERDAPEHDMDVDGSLYQHGRAEGFREGLEAAAFALCGWCKSGWKFKKPGIHVSTDGVAHVACRAQEILALQPSDAARSHIATCGAPDCITASPCQCWCHRPWLETRSRERELAQTRLEEAEWWAPLLATADFNEGFYTAQSKNHIAELRSGLRELAEGEKI